MLFVDRLGMKAALRHGTAAGMAHLAGFQDLIAALLSESGPLDAAVESDSGVALFPNVESAIACGEHLFRTVFDADGIWMRGVIVGCTGIVSVSDLKIDRRERGVLISSPAPALLTALVAEKGGFRGFRLRVESLLLDEETRRSLRKTIVTEDPYDNVAPPTAQVHRTQALAYADSPAGDGFEDVLWMLDNEPEFNARDADLSDRLRHSGANSEEVPQAAMTKVVFEDVRAMAGITRR